MVKGQLSGQLSPHFGEHHPTQRRGSPLGSAGFFGQIGGKGQWAEQASLSKQEAPCHKDKVALPVALQGPASVLLSLWRVGQRERGPRSP